MFNKIIEYDVELLSTKQKNQYTLPTVFTNDLDSVEFRFNITDTTLDLALATADVLLYMHDGSFFQNTSESGVTIEGNTVKYLLKENEGNHSGTSEVQIIVKNGGPEYASQLYKFHIQKGLESVVATEVMIHDWTTLTRTAQEYIDEFYANEVTRQSTFDTNESTRATTFNYSETTRGTTFSTNETTRQSSEDIRVANENTRIVSESDREASEVTRIANEESRLTVEAARVEAEDIRSAFYTGFDGKLEATQLQTVKNTKQTSELTEQISNVNVNQEATQAVDTNADSASLPVNAGNGAMDANLAGMTATQVIQNGDFSDGVTGWVAYNVSSVVKDGVLETTHTGTTHARIESPQLITSLDDLIYYSIDKYTPIDAGYSTVSLIAPTESLLFQPPKTATWVRLSAIKTSGAKIQRLRLYLSSEAAISEGAPHKMRNLRAINLTQTFGAGNEPTKEVCDIIFDSYFNGTKAVTPGRVKSVGKNLFDGDTYVTENYDNRAYSVTDFTNAQALVGKTITVSHKLKTGFSQYKVSSSYAGVNISHATTATITVTVLQSWVDAGYKLYIGYLTGYTIDFNSLQVQIEEGTTATPYEPYTETLQYVEPVTLNRVPNGVADEITANGDFVQRVKEYRLVESDMTDLNTTFTNFDFVRVPNLPNYIGGSSKTQFSVEGYPVVTYDGENTPVNSVWVISTVQWGMTFPKGIYATLAAARADLAGTKIYYQLATPIIHPNVTTGKIISHPKGTVYFEHYQADAGMYSNGIEISNPDLAIKSLESLSVLDFMTGDEKDLDVSQVVLTDRTFTHSELVDGDLVFFTYEFDGAGPNGNKSLSFYDSRYTIKDDVTGDFYKWSIKVSNGVPQITVEGV